MPLSDNVLEKITLHGHKLLVARLEGDALEFAITESRAKHEDLARVDAQSAAVLIEMIKMAKTRDV